MSTARNKEVVQAYMDLFGRADIDGLLAMMTEDATWTIVGKPHLFAGVGEKSRGEIENIWRKLYAGIDGGLDMAVTGMIAEGDQVAVEVVSHAQLTNGTVYENAYHFLVTVRDGRIAAVKEYTDLMHAAEIFG
ncbi:nuclear transport factor 2 family protein [Sphingomonas ginsenosidivorax]|uniref:Nuclear transport factor 2 family protein n=1 Tax=Sphingomonas ginsenosidivorax TaxID=862135 RepID=A0A5C6UGK1_9SPHN|nr:nuclear transport factor 2 family protein [Sphingomonas ginsenosidivorax]TXC71296.1 nuclear transport factor 2 family protein [Sphingomonas ginsenosidivorax]